MSEYFYVNETELENLRSKLDKKLVELKGESQTSCRTFLLQCSHEICEIMQNVMKFCNNFTWNHIAISVLLVNVSITKTFLEIMLIMFDKNQLQLTDSKLCNIFTNKSFFDCLISVKEPPMIALFGLAELLSFFIFVSYNFSHSQTYFDKLQCLICKSVPNLKYYLYVIYNLCVVSKDYNCEGFNDFLFGNSGILNGQYLSTHLFSSETDAQIVTLRIYRSVFFTEKNKIARAVILKNITTVASFSKAAKSPIVRRLYWNFLEELLPFRNEYDGDDNLPISASKFILNEVQYMNERDVVLQSFVGDVSEEKQISPITINLVLKCATWISKSDDFDNADVIMFNLNHLRQLILRNSATDSIISSQSLVGMLMEDDESLVDFLLLQLELYCFSQQRMSASAIEESFIFNPFELFLELLKALSYDSSILLDWLTSNETKFLQYFVQYLKISQSCWKEFTEICIHQYQEITSNSEGITSLELIISTLTRLKISIVNLDKSNLFPYSPSPILKRLNAIETLFEEKR